jgi:hypothetical protein
MLSIIVRLRMRRITGFIINQILVIVNRSTEGGEKLATPSVERFTPNENERCSILAMNVITENSLHSFYGRGVEFH